MAKILCTTEVSHLDKDYREVSWDDGMAGIVSFDSRFAIHAVDTSHVSASPTEPKCAER